MALPSQKNSVTATSDLDGYFSSIDYIAQSGHEHADYLDIIHAKRLASGASRRFNYYYENDGPNDIGSNTLSRTALAHKILFDYTQSDIKVFANGLHPNIYESDIVIDSFKAYVKRAISAVSDDFVPMEIIAKGLNADSSSLSNIFDSKFFHAAKDLQHLYGEKVLDVYKQSEDNSSVSITPIKFTSSDRDHTVEILSQDITKQVNRISAFCIYGDFYRFRLFHQHKNHFALINFGDSIVANVLRRNFESIKESCTKIEI